MSEASFYEVYPEAAEFYLASGLSIEAVDARYGARSDWVSLRSMLLGTDGIPPHSVPGESSDWYFLSSSHEYWPVHLRLLTEKKKWGSRAIQSLDIASSKVVNYLFDPSSPGKHVRHGLVIGHVQSGKTANFSAVIAKAADAGYNLIIVLTGLYNDLRDQTQSRLSKELSGTAEDPEGQHVVSSEYQVRWKEETDGQRDFHNIATHATPAPNTPTLAVIKKNVSPLSKIIEWVDSFSGDLLGDLNVLIIDDEADHASVNMMTGEDVDEFSGEPENSPSRINRLLRTLIKKLPRVSYVGYTATPFANVFIDPDECDEELGETLYPKDFIVSLPKPQEHFGLEEVFPSDPTIDAFPHVVIVPQHEADVLRAMTTDPQSSIPTRDVPKSMQDALIDYLLSGAVRSARGEQDFHHTMMVHTKHTLDAMTPLVRRIRAIVQDFTENLPRTTSKRGKVLEQDIRERWDSEYVANGFADQWSTVRAELMKFVLHSPPDILEINMGSEDVLNFDAHRAQGLRAIAIGGNRLSRGLTLEGLCVSFFIRPTTTHDTLMQMSRWFGFREAHSDLIRVHVTTEISERFTGMVRVERELRDDLERYEQQSELTPLDFGVRILRQEEMMPTRAGARRNVRIIDVGGTEDQTVQYTNRFHFDDARLLEDNLKALAEFVASLGGHTPAGSQGESMLWKGIGPTAITEFLGNLEFPEQYSWHLDRILAHINQRVEAAPDELSAWRFAIIGLQTGEARAPLSEYGLDDLKLVLPRRTRLAGTNSVGMMPGPWDFVIDLDYPREEFQTATGTGFSYNRMWERREPAHPLLLAYVVDKDSCPDPTKARQEAKPRTELFRDGEVRSHVLALALALPRANISADERARQREYWIRESAEPFPGLS